MIRRWGIVFGFLGILAFVAVAVGRKFLEAAPPAGTKATGVGAELGGEAGPDSTTASVRFQVESGESLQRVAYRLEAEGLIVSALRFRMLSRLLGEDRGIQVGTYAFLRGTPPRRILEDLKEGRVVLVKLTIPEGWRIGEIAGEAERVLGISRVDFLKAASAPERLQRLQVPSDTLEGYLFPETYLFPEGVAADEVVDEMLTRFESNWKRVATGVDSVPLNLDRHQVVVLASIVEAETGVPEERSRIAAVYLNRLRIGWKLQADPTVRYALGKYEGDVLYKDLEVASPYNTYWTMGLPPGPIGAPGLASLQATLSPLTGCDDLYFVASGSGGHVFTKSLGDHERAKQAAKRKRAEGDRIGG